MAGMVSGHAIVRPESAADREAVRRVNTLAFDGDVEADLVEALHRDGLTLSSLVAEVDGTVVGHILFSRMWVDTPSGPVDAVCLAPMAVEPSHQRRGVGGALIGRGVDEVRRLGERLIIVLGHPSYYPRFGFGPATGLLSPFPSEAFMAMELAPGALAQAAGRVRYPAPFGI